MHDKPARFIDNHDGDNVTMLLDLDFHLSLEVEIRLANVWAPELVEDGGIHVKAYSRHLMTGPDVFGKWPFIVHSHVTSTGNHIKSFDRYVATVMMPDGESLNSKLMAYIIDRGFTTGIGRAGISK